MKNIQDEVFSGRNYLKYLMLGEDLSCIELDLINKYYDEKYFKDGYRVACILKNRITHNNYNMEIVCSIEQHSIIIMREKEFENAENLLLYAGISKKYDGVNQISRAYEQALLFRKIAFCRNMTIASEPTCEFDYELFHQEINSKNMIKMVKTVDSRKINDTFIFLRNVLKILEAGEISFEKFEKNMNILLVNITETFSDILGMEDIEQISELENILNYECSRVYISNLIKLIAKINEITLNKEYYCRDERRIVEAIKFMDENFHRDLNMAVVSNHISMGYSVFSSLFNKYSGGNFSQYLENVRILEAEKLLKNTSLSINEISHKVGYKSDKYFMKLFKKKHGVSPSQYRKLVNIRN